MNNNVNILAIVVLFFPKKNQLLNIINNVSDQVSKVCIIDNTDNLNFQNKNVKICKNFENVEYVSSCENLGIAKAQNIGINYALENNFSHILLLDQDSLIPPNMIDKLLLAENTLLTNRCKVAAIGPSFRDIKSGVISGVAITKLFRILIPKIDPKSNKILETDYLISSGSLIRTSIFESVGYMQEDLFIDWVDIEWGERCNRAGFSSYVVSNAVMEHSIGDSIVNFIGREISLHSDFRNYFIIRNALRLISSKSFNLKSKVNMFFKAFWYLFIFTLNSRNKRKSFFIYLQAFKDAIIGNMGIGFFSS